MSSKNPVVQSKGPYVRVCFRERVCVCVCDCVCMCVCVCERECANDRKEERLRDWETYRKTDREGKRKRENVYICVSKRMCE